MRKTKIIATLGPACSESKILQEMFKIGLSAVRINTAHISPGDVKRARRSVDSTNALEGTHVGLIVDLKGPELRTGEFRGGAYKVSKGKRYKLSSSSKGSDISLNNESVFRMIKENDVVLMSDGMVQFKTIESDGSSAVVLAVNGGTLRDRSRVNIPGRILDLGTVTNRDKLFIDEGIKAGVEFFALSFVQSRSNVLELQKMVLESGGNSEIVSKIETKSGLSSTNFQMYLSKESNSFLTAMNALAFATVASIFIDEGIKAGVEFFALSFVQNRSNVLELQKNGS